MRYAIELGKSPALVVLLLVLAAVLVAVFSSVAKVVFLAVLI